MLRYRERERTREDDSRSSEETNSRSSYLGNAAYPSVYFISRRDVNLSITDVNFRSLYGNDKMVQRSEYSRDREREREIVK